MDDLFKEFLQEALKKEAQAIEDEVLANSTLADINATEEMKEALINAIKNHTK